MSYADEQRAYRAQLEISGRHLGLFDPGKLTAPPEEYTAPEQPGGPGVRMSHAELDEAERALAEKYGAGPVRDAVYLAHATADLGRSENERHAVLYRVERALRRGQAEVDAEGIAGLRESVLKLAAQQGADFGPGGAEGEAVRLAAEHAGILGLAVSAAERRSLAKKGHALGPDGDFPIPDVHHLGLAKAEYRKGNLAGHSRAEVRDHINRNARRLGQPGLEDDDGDGDEAGLTVGLTQETAARRASRAGADPAAEIARLTADNADMFRR